MTTRIHLFAGSHRCDSRFPPCCTPFLCAFCTVHNMSQPESTSTLFSPSKDASPDRKRPKFEYAQLIGPSFVRLQALGFAGLSKCQMDLRFIDTSDGTSISDSVRTILTEKKLRSKLRFTPREVQKGNGPKTTYGYMSGTLAHCICFQNLVALVAFFAVCLLRALVPGFTFCEVR
jgi:hypothetical protein